MRNRILLAVVLIGLFGSTLPVVAQTRSSTSTQLRELREEVRKLRESQNAIESELRELKLLVQQLKLAQAATPLNFVSTDDDPFIGSSDAKVVMIDFSDYQCPFCANFVRDTKPRLDREYFSTGKVRYVFRDLPLEAIHPQAFKAAEAANCAQFSLLRRGRISGRSLAAVV